MQFGSLTALCASFCRPSGASIVIAAMVLALMLSGAAAQSMGGAGGVGGGGGFGGFGGGGRNHQQKTTNKPAEQKPKVDEKAYAAALKSLPNKKYDPWHNVR
jgi:Spy/CpxP family protein refolding chaperone